MLTEHKYKALAIIATTINGELLPYIFDLDDPHAYWKKLQDLFETHNVARSLFLIHKLLSIKMEEGYFIFKVSQKDQRNNESTC
jgi:hypothetical protein